MHGISTVTQVNYSIASTNSQEEMKLSLEE